MKGNNCASVTWKMARRLIWPVCLASILLATSSCLAAGIAMQSITGPAHGTWSHNVTLSVTLWNSGTTTSSSGSLEISLKARTGTVDDAQLLTSLPVSAMAPGQSTTLPVTCVLLAPPDPCGRGDGDFDIVVAFRPTNGNRLVLDSSHPIHVETRDEWGNVNGRYTPRVYDLVSAQAAPGVPSPDWLVQTGIRNSRDNCAWGWYEPQDGVWDQTQFGPTSPLGSLILQARKYDMTTIPTLCNIPDWAQSTNALGQKLGAWGPPADPARWGAFVDKVVGYYSKAPYNQRDWQIWNEAGEYDYSYCFWQGTYEDYIDKIHNPAANAIRSHYVDYNGNGKEDPGERCRVIYGGFPDTDAWGGLYNYVLNLHGCGASTDILDAHYMTFPWFESSQSGDVYSKWVKTGKALGCWITECGWDYADSAYWTPRYYFQALEWALNHDWHDKDKYRMYFFAYYAAEDNKGLFWINSQRKWPNGYSLKTLIDMLPGDLEPIGPSRTIANTSGVPVDAMLAGGRLVIAPLLETDGQTSFSVALKPGENVRSVNRFSGMNGVQSSVPFVVQNGSLKFDVAWVATRTLPTMDGPLAPICYIVVECDQAMTTTAVDTTPPGVPGTPMDGGAYSTGTVAFGWNSALDEGSGLVGYNCQIGTTPGGSDVFNGSVGNVLGKSITGANGVTYYCRVQAVDFAGNIGLWSPSSDGVTADTVGPTGSILINGGASYTNGTYTALTLSATDPVSGLYQMRFSNNGTTWSSAEAYSTIRYRNVPSGDGPKTEYVQYFDNAGNTSSAYGSTITLDQTAPTSGAAAVAGSTHRSPVSVTYAGAYDATSGVKKVELWNKKGSGGVWTAASSPAQTGTSGSFTFTDISGDDTYYFALVAEDNAGNRSSTPTGGGNTSTVYTLTPIPIAQVKAAADASVVSTQGVVTASFEDSFYIEADDRSSGIQIAGPASVTPGNVVTVVGSVGTAPNGERQLTPTTLTISAEPRAVPGAVAITNASLGGGDWTLNESSGTGQQGVSGWQWVAVGSDVYERQWLRSRGLNNIGLLVRIWGQVAQLEEVTPPALPGWFLVDDGSDAIVKVTVPAGVTVPGVGSFVCVTGISSCEKTGSDLSRLLKVSRQSDITP